MKNILFLILAAALAAGSGNAYGTVSSETGNTVGYENEESGTEPKEEENSEVIDGEISLCQENIGVSEYAARAIVETLHELGSASVTEAVVVSSERSLKVLLTDEEGKVYFAVLDSLGYPGVIRADGEDGEVLYRPMDD